MSGYTRFVALGDSQTEGLNDLDVSGVPRGWADRFAVRMAAVHPGLTYANLAVRACRARHVRNVQLPAALDLHPDLASVAVGMNDMLRHDYDLEETVAQVEETFVALQESGARVLTMTFPDIERMLPVMGWLAPRQRVLNARLREVARRHHVDVLELSGLSINADPGMWSHDRIHGSAVGHEHIAHGMAELLGLPGADGSWRDSDGAAPGRVPTVLRDARWLGTFLMPFLVRQARGRSPQTHVAKRPFLTAVSTDISA